MEFFDTHCHINHQAYNDDRDIVLERSESAGVSRLLVIGYDLASSRFALELTRLGSQGHPDRATGTDSAQESTIASTATATPSKSARASANPTIYAAIGIHPESAGEWNTDAKALLREYYQSKGRLVAAYGEIGLDYHWESVPRSVQTVVLEEQVAFAQTLRSTLPIIIHCRDAFQDILGVLRHCTGRAPVVMHCFTGNTADARACVDAGYYLGIGGVATFKKSNDIRDAVAFAPTDRILLETDCPYLAPQRWRGKRNEPSYLPAIAEVVATVKGLPVEDIARITTENALRIFEPDSGV